MKSRDLFTQADFDKLRGIKPKVRRATSNMVRTAKPHEDKTKFNARKERRSFKDHLRRGIHEQQVLTNVRLSNHQKSVLANMIARGGQNTTMVDITANVDDINKQNMSGAVNTLAKVGLIVINPDKTLAVTDQGNATMAQENLVDPSGQLTPDGQKFQFMFTKGEEGKDQDDVGQEMAPVDMNQPPAELDQAGGMDMGGGSDPLGMESFSLIASMILERKFKS